jgi:hypothetical protein
MVCAVDYTGDTAARCCDTLLPKRMSVRSLLAWAEDTRSSSGHCRLPYLIFSTEACYVAAVDGIAIVIVERDIQELLAMHSNMSGDSAYWDCALDRSVH